MRVLALAWGVALLALAGPGASAQESAEAPEAAVAEAAAPPPVTIGIAPFEQVAPPGVGAPDLSNELAAQILARGAGPTVSPASLAGERDAEPSPERVRDLAREHGFDALVVGRVTRLGSRLSVDVRLRDGPSGAVAGTYVAELPMGQPAEAVLGRLSTEIVSGARDLPRGASAGAASAPGAPGAPGAPSVSARPAGAAPGDTAAAPSPRERRRDRPDRRRGGLELDALGGDQPFSIRSDELEVSEGESGGRQLIFRGNVLAERGDLLLRTGRLEATYPPGDKQPSRLAARGSVLVRQGDQEGRCRRADYRRSEQRVVCTGDAVLRDGSDELRGDAIVFDLADRSVTVEGGTEVALTPRAGASDGGKQDASEPTLLGDLSSDGGPVKITAKHLEAQETDDGGRRIRFEGDVVVIQQDMTLRANRIDAVYPPDASEPDRLVASGEVVVNQQDREARCDEAVYRRVERRVDCRGNASMQEGEDRVTGRSIAFDLAAEKLVVTGDTRLVLAPRARDDGEETATP